MIGESAWLTALSALPARRGRLHRRCPPHHAPGPSGRGGGPPGRRAPPPCRPHPSAGRAGHAARLRRRGDRLRRPDPVPLAAPRRRRGGHPGHGDRTTSSTSIWWQKLIVVVAPGVAFYLLGINITSVDPRRPPDPARPPRPPGDRPLGGRDGGVDQLHGRRRRRRRRGGRDRGPGGDARAINRIMVPGDLQSGVVILSAALMGVCLGFLVFNLPPARTFMGDTGSHFLGAVLAAITIVGTPRWRRHLHPGAPDRSRPAHQRHRLGDRASRSCRGQPDHARRAPPPSPAAGPGHDPDGDRPHLLLRSTGCSAAWGSRSLAIARSLDICFYIPLPSSLRSLQCSRSPPPPAAAAGGAGAPDSRRTSGWRWADNQEAVLESLRHPGDLDSLPPAVTGRGGGGPGGRVRAVARPAFDDLRLWLGSRTDLSAGGCHGTGRWGRRTAARSTPCAKLPPCSPGPARPGWNWASPSRPRCLPKGVTARPNPSPLAEGPATLARDLARGAPRAAAPSTRPMIHQPTGLSQLPKPTKMEPSATARTCGRVTTPPVTASRSIHHPGGGGSRTPPPGCPPPPPDIPAHRPGAGASTARPGGSGGLHRKITLPRSAEDDNLQDLAMAKVREPTQPEHPRLAKLRR